MLISAKKTFDYIEGFVIINRTGILNNWRSSFNPQDPVQANHFKSDGKTLFCLEMTKNFNADETDIMNQVKINQNTKNDMHAKKKKSFLKHFLIFAGS